MNFLWWHTLKAKVSGKNSVSTPVAVISDQMNELRMLPLGVQEFEEWSDRIISGLPTLIADVKTQKFALAQMIMHLGPQESHKPDIFFFKTLLKAAANQIAHAKIVELQAEDRAKKEAAQAIIQAAKLAQLEEEAKATLARAQTSAAAVEVENKVEVVK